MTEQTQTETSAPARAVAGTASEPVSEPKAEAASEPVAEPRAEAASEPVTEPRAEAAPAKPRKSRGPLLRGIARWTAAVLVCGAVGTGTAMGITSMERTDVPGLATESDGRWEYPELALPALPEDALRPFTEGNEGEIHHADLRELLLPAPAGAAVDPELDGGWVGLDPYLALMKQKDRGEVKQELADSALRHVAARGWTMPDGTTTRIHLLRFSSVAFSEAHKDEAVREVSAHLRRLPDGVESAEIDMEAQGADVPYVSVYAYEELRPYGPEQTRWAYVQAGDTLAVVTQTRKGGAPAVPFRQTVALQAQLLG
ncbi:hypothetical protein GCM10010275_66110 [Streptomyces litmocidini]|uniref:hypothetical protein n=1 Tax=Streptomyces litmocidini TaxID=67318 RepID=UPI00167EC5A0|nr:hypothetical protein [Streptomyces litmocidini]GGV15503.1 hypothetical protein GCM10010275_66110 [Streptomyces litmocidini]